MLKKVLNIFDAPFTRMLRSLACFMFAFFSLGLIVSGAVGQTRSAAEYDKVANEVHFTQLDDEIRVLQDNIKSLRDDAKENRFYHWLELTGMSGLLVEMGARLGKKVGPK